MSTSPASTATSLPSLLTRRLRWSHFLLLLPPFFLTFAVLHDRLLGPSARSASALFRLHGGLPFLFAAYTPHSFTPLPHCPAALQLSRFATNASAPAQRTLYVSATSPSSSSAASVESPDGSQHAPFPTVQQALDAVASLRQASPSTPITVALAPGLHYQPTSLLLTAAHSGAEDALLTITSSDSNHPASLAGGLEIPSSCFQPLSSLPPASLSRIPAATHPHLLSVHLPSCLSLPLADVVPALLSYGFSQPVLPSHQQLYLDSAPLHLARWPNLGSAWQRIADVVDQGSVIRNGELDKRGFVFTMSDDATARVHSWQSGNGVGKAQNVWMQGYWVFDWAEQTVRVAAVHGSNVSSVHASHYGVKQNARYHFYNVLEELDSPGEYYIDEQGWLYLYPPHRYVTESDKEAAQREEKDLRLSSSGSVASMPLSHLWLSLSPYPVVTFSSAHHIRLHHLTVELTRDSGIRVLSSHHLLLDSLEVRRIGNVGVMCGYGAPVNRRYTAGGDDDTAAASAEEWEDAVVGDMGQAVYHRNFLDTLWDRRCGACITLAQSHLHTLGAGGVIMGGGERLSLTPAHNAVTNNHIHAYSQLWHTYRPAVWLDGVGQLLAHNVIGDGPHTAVLLNGNNHRVEYNDISAVCAETSDVGVIYTGRDLTQRGHRIAHNFIHHISALAPVLLSSSTSASSSDADDQSYVKVGTDASAVYFDDLSGGSTVTGNVFYRVHRGVLIGGGSGHTVTDNLFLQCEVPVHLDARALSSHKALVLPGATLWQRLAVTPVGSERWRAEYGDALAELAAEDEVGRHARVGRPVNSVQHNAMIGCGPLRLQDADLIGALPVDNLLGGRQLAEGETPLASEEELVRLLVDGVNATWVWDEAVSSVRPLLYGRHSVRLSASGVGGSGDGQRHVCYDACVQYGWMLAKDIDVRYERLTSRAGWRLEDLDVQRMGACCMQSGEDADDGRNNRLSSSAPVLSEAG